MADSLVATLQSSTHHINVSLFEDDGVDGLAYASCSHGILPLGGG
jgi:hypothetical protein